MTMKELTELVYTNEPLLQFRKVNYQILHLQGHCLVAVSNDESTHTWFNDSDNLLTNWAPDGISIAQAVTDIKHI